jgi:hypothetical protein
MSLTGSMTQPIRQEFVPVAQRELAIQSFVCHGQLDDENAATMKR